MALAICTVANPKMDKLIDDAGVELDQAKRLMSATGPLNFPLLPTCCTAANRRDVP